MHETERHNQRTANLHHLRSHSLSSSSSSSNGTTTGTTTIQTRNGQAKNGQTSSRMPVEKAARKLRSTLTKASRLGVTTNELARLPAAKRIVSSRDHDWKLAVLLLLMFSGGVIVALVCTSSRGCNNKMDEISVAT